MTANRLAAAQDLTTIHHGINIIGMKWLALAAQVVEKIPIERLLVRRPDEVERRREMARILTQAKPEPAEKPPGEIPEPPADDIETPQLGNLGNLRPKVRLENNPAVTSSVSDKETVDYQNREIGKILLVMQRHLVQKFRINNKACDCGQSRHLLDLEALAEETIGMVENPDIYYRILEWIRRLGPISTIENVSSGKYDDIYPEFSNECRELRKELLGTLDAKVLFPPKEEVEKEEQEVT
ncbi:hypothetical protein KKE60_05355 [Patescibacteria group bacterium]|nr:hypothetical protein [Patescibacteria group bacterium]